MRSASGRSDGREHVLHAALGPLHREHDRAVQLGRAGVVDDERLERPDEPRVVGLLAEADLLGDRLAQAGELRRRQRPARHELQRAVRADGGSSASAPAARGAPRRRSPTTPTRSARRPPSRRRGSRVGTSTTTAQAPRRGSSRRCSSRTRPKRSAIGRERLALGLQPLVGAGPRLLDAQLLDREVVDVVVDGGAREVAAALVPAQPLDDLGGGRQRDRRAVAQARLAERDEDEEVLRRLVERERRGGALARRPAAARARAPRTRAAARRRGTRRAPRSSAARRARTRTAPGAAIRRGATVTYSPPPSGLSTTYVLSWLRFEISQ